MKVIDVRQGSPEWVDARIGRITASEMDHIVTPGGKLSAGVTANKYLARLVAEWFLNCPLCDYASGYMARGTEMEKQAAGWYAFETGTNPEPVGLCLTDDEVAGASPDRLVGDDGLLEIKCPNAENHTLYLIGGMTNEYRVQVQGQLWVTGRKWVDLVSFHPTLPKVKMRIERDEEFIEMLAENVGLFAGRLDEERAKLATERAEYHAGLQARFEDDQLLVGGGANTGGEFRWMPRVGDN